MYVCIMHVYVGTVGGIARCSIIAENRYVAVNGDDTAFGGAGGGGGGVGGGGSGAAHDYLPRKSGCPAAIVIHGIRIIE